MLVYILDAYLKFMGWKHNEVASGGCGSSPFIREARTQNYWGKFFRKDDAHNFPVFIFNNAV